MKEYIEREALLKELELLAKYEYGERRQGILGVCATIRNKPSADVVEVRHGDWKWGYQNGQYGIWCTNCGAGWTDSENAEWIAHEHDYCPKCGADMRKSTVKPTVCANCGNEMYFTDGTCHYCGAKVDRKGE